MAQLQSVQFDYEIAKEKFKNPPFIDIPNPNNKPVCRLNYGDVKNLCASSDTNCQSSSNDSEDDNITPSHDNSIIPSRIKESSKAPHQYNSVVSVPDQIHNLSSTKKQARKSAHEHTSEKRKAMRHEDDLSEQEEGEYELPAHQYHSSSVEEMLSPRSREELRLRVNCRERQRMHDLNAAMDSLREVST